MSDTEELRRSATVRAKSQVTLPPEIRSHLHVAEGDEVEFTVTESGAVVLRGLTKIPSDQAWFWSSQWQEGEHEASASIKAGEVTTFEDAEEMFGALDR